MHWPKLEIEIHLSQELTALAQAPIADLGPPEIARALASALGATDEERARTPTMNHITQVTISIPSQAVTLRLDPRHVTLELDWPEEIARGASLAAAYLATALDQLGIPRPIANATIETFWLQPFDLDAAGLAALLKRRMGKPLTSLDQAAEVAGLYTLSDGRGNEVSLGMGPIEPDELAGFRLQPRPEVQARPMLLLDVEMDARATRRLPDVVAFEAISEVVSTQQSLANRVASEMAEEPQ